MAAAGEIWADLQEAFGPLGSKPRSAMVAGLAAHQFGMALVPLASFGLIFSASPTPSSSPSQTLPLKSSTSGPTRLILASSSQGLPLSP